MTFWETQMAHEPTRLYYEKLKYIIKDIITEIRPYSVLEIGLDVGISARCLLEFPDVKLTSVDCGDVEGGVKHIEEWGFKDRWTFHHMRSDDYFAACDKKFDIIYVDGDHAYAQTKRDIDNAWKFLEPGGVLIGHDFLHKHNFDSNNPYDKDSYGVTRAFREFMCENNVDARVYPPEPGLIVISK